MISDEIPEHALDYDEIFRRGGRNCGDEDFALCKCPHCGAVYLFEYEIDTIFLNADDLTQRLSAFDIPHIFDCVACFGRFPETDAWIGPRSPLEMRVTWPNLAASPWRWVTQQTR